LFGLQAGIRAVQAAVSEVKSFALFAVTILAALFSGCKKENLPDTHHIVRQAAPFRLSPIPTGSYDALFECYDACWYYNDSLIHHYTVNVTFPTDARELYHIPKGMNIPSTMNISLNGIALHRGAEEKFPLNFPEPLTWLFTGDDRYPSVTHTIFADSPIEFLLPGDGDSISLSHGFDVFYHAPKSVDSVTFHMTYFGKGIYKNDTTKIQKTAQSYYYVVPNTGRYVVAPYKMMDRFFKSFDPERLMVQIMWAHGDTMHVGDCVYGFSVQGHTVHTFKLKP
jgi:hypothetical protein